ncbi:MAG: helix-turn-helix domain-containing protein [Chitinophagales bacterium]|nr:helix-turn-helix domain-containing protein [Chitinophagales bacterium]
MSDKEFLKRMGEHIRRVRKEKNISLKTLGALCDIDHTSISRIENGHFNSYVLTLKRITDVLEIEVKELFS